MIVEMDDNLKRICRLSYTIASAIWLGGPRTKEEREALARKRRADRRAVDAILAGMPDPAIMLSGEAFDALGDETNLPHPPDLRGHPRNG